jgi:hypothetical protein
MAFPDHMSDWSTHMARYTKMEIWNLCNRLEDRADSVINTMPASAGDMKAAAMLLRLLSQLADVQEVEIEPIGVNRTRPYSIKN